MSGDHLIRYSVQVLGQITVEGPDGPVEPGGPKPRLLLAMLVAHAGGVVTTERLIDGLWNDDPPPTARKTLQVHVSQLRRNLGPAFPLATARAGYRIDADSVAIDAVHFEEEVGRGGALRESSPADAGTLLATALARWTGPAYADVAAQEVIRPEVARLDELRLTAVEQRIETDLRLGRHETVLGELEALTTDHPYREHLRGLHMVALYRAGRQTDALRAYDRTRRILAEELGIDPGPDLRQLQQQVLDQSPRLDLVPAVVGGRSTAATAAATTATGSEACAVAWSVRGYELRERLGERNGIAVHRAYQASVGREVAIRIISPGIANDVAFVARFEADCRLLVELAHPHIVGLYDFWRDPGGAYVVMPLLGGGTLDRSLEEGPWGPAAALQLLDQVGSALNHAHRRGLIHGDLRPSNVILDADRNAFLSDFLLHGDIPRAVTQPCDPAYTSPEVMAGRPIGPAADIYGLAVLTCHVLTGVGPDHVGFTQPTLPSGFDDLIARATDEEPLRRFDTVDDFMRGLRRTFGADVVTPGRPRPAPAARNPYKGLRAFGEADAMDFFGRDELLTELVERVSTSNLTTVVGPSGSGKSSLVRAGLLPAVRRGALGGEREVVIAEMFPGSYPFEELESALLRVAVDRPADLLVDLRNDPRGLMRVAKQILPGDDTDLLLVIDQFEELFALTADEEVRRDFIAGLVTVAADVRSRVRVVLTLRADFYDRPLTYSAFGRFVKRSLITVTLPDDDGLAGAIAEPARRVGIDIEPGLIPTILRDVASEPGALPLLQYALTELADDRRDELTIDGYHRTGGVVGALARRAEEIFTDLTPAGREAAREVFLRLVTVSDEADDTRRRVRRTELQGLGIAPSSLNAVIGAFGSFRLLSFDHDPVTRGPTVEVAHEALIREWPRYRQWVEERRDDLRTERRLDAAVAEWRAGDRDPSLLISGGRLERYEQWVDSADVRLTADEQTFLDESNGHERKRTAAQAKRRRRLLAGVSVLAVLALLAAAVALVQRNRADDQARVATAAAAAEEQLRVAAERDALVNESRALMARAATENDPDLRLLLALEAHESLDAEGIEEPAVTSALYQFALDQSVDERLSLDSYGWVDVKTSPAGTMFVATDPPAGHVRVVDVETGATLATLTIAGKGRGSTPYFRLALANWDTDAGSVMTGRTDGTIEFWEPTGERVHAVDVQSGRAARPLFARDGVLGVAQYGSSFDGFFKVVVQDRTTGAVKFRSPLAVDAILSPSGGHLMIREDERGVRLIDAETWVDVTPARLYDARRGATADDVSWAASGEDIWLLEEGQLARVDIATGEETMRIDTGLLDAMFVAESLDGQLAAVTGGERSPVRVYNTATGKLSVELARPDLSLELASDIFTDDALTWAADRRLVFGGEAETIVWNLRAPNAAGAAWPGTDLAPVVTVRTASGGLVIAGDGGVDVFGPDGRLQRSFGGAGTSEARPVVSGDGVTLARSVDGAVEIVEVATGHVRATGPAGFDRPLALTNDGQLLVVGTPRTPDNDLHSVALVDAATGELLSRVGSQHDGERGAFTSDGEVALIPIEPYNAEPGLWAVDASTGRRLGWGPPERCITAVAVSADDTTAATVGCDGRVSLYDIATLKGPEPWTARIRGATDDRTPGVGVTFGPEDETVIVTRQDGRVEAYAADADFERLWSFDVGDHVGMPTVRDGMVWVGATTPYVSAEAASGGVIAMPLDLDELVAFARGSVTRELTDEECQEYLNRASCADT